MTIASAVLAGNLLLPGAYYGGLNFGGDLGSTEYAIEHGAKESNPYGQTYGNRVALKGGITVALTLTDYVLQEVEKKRVVSRAPGRMPEKRKPTVAKVATAAKWGLRAAALGYYARLTIKNWKVGEEARRQR